MNSVIGICLLLWVGYSCSLPVSDEGGIGRIDNGISGQNASQDVQHAIIGSKVCMDELGCFVITAAFFHPMYRAINFLPKDRVTINTRFELYTRSSPDKPYMLQANKPDGITGSAINPKVPTKFIVHGFMDNKLFGRWLLDVKDNYLKSGEYNVIIVDWSHGNGAPYAQAAANTRVVGAEIALLITTLNKLKGVSLSDCHVIGHSLGAHVGGYAGERLKKLGRITGLDPAEPYYQYMPVSVRLDRSDADFVDVIHTDSKSIVLMGMGMSQSIGHVDFFPNSGKNQPGCNLSKYISVLTDGLVDGSRKFAACNHQRSVDLFINSINNKNAPAVGYECGSWKKFLDGECADCGSKGDKCAIMGDRADEFRRHKNDRKSLDFYLTTSAKAPFWMSHYQVSVKLHKTSGSKNTKGKLFVTLNGAKKSFKTTLTGAERIALKHGTTYPFLVATDNDLGEIKSITFSFEGPSGILFLSKSDSIFLEYVQLVPMSITDEAERKRQTKKFCDDPKTAISSKQTKELTKTNC